MKSDLFLNCGLSVLLSCFAVNVSAEIFTLSKVRKSEEGGTFKDYKIANRVVEVDYQYYNDAMLDGPLIKLNFKKSDTSLKDILRYGLSVDNFDSPTIQRSQIVSKGLNGDESCIYVGKAKLLLSKVWLYYSPTEISNGVTVNKVILASPPELECNSSY